MEDIVESMMELTKVNPLIMRKLIPLPPYNFTYFLVETLRDAESGDNHYLAKEFSVILDNVMNKNSNEFLRLIKIDELLISLIERTDNDIFYRPLITPTMFIDNEFIFENKTIKGIAVIDLQYYEKLYGYIKQDVKINLDSENNIFICFFYYDMSTYQPSYDFCTFDSDIGSSNINLKSYIRNIICNTLDMICAMDEKLNITTIETTKEQNEKRIRRKQIPMPTKIFIKPKDEFKQYVYKFMKDTEDGIRKIGHKFLVRGHWRRFRADRYNKETKKNPIWIKPFWKGEGIPIAKEYMVKK